MATPPFAGAQDFTLLTTKLYIPPHRPNLVPRPRLIERLDEGLRLGHRLTLLSAQAGFGKTTLLSEWVRHSERPTGWLWLDEGDNDLARCLAYLIAALGQIDDGLGLSAQAVLQASQPPLPPSDVLLTAIINEMAAAPDEFVLILDDYHLIRSPAIHDAFSFLQDRLPANAHLVIATRTCDSGAAASRRGIGKSQLRILGSHSIRRSRSQLLPSS